MGGVIFLNELVEIKYVSPQKGKGLFAKRDIKKNTLIEIAYVLLLHNTDWELIQESALYNYIFTWDDPKKPDHMNVIAFSICQFMNHSFEPNVQYLFDYDAQTIEYHSIKEILKGEELTVNYNGIVNDKSPVWFELEH